MAMWTVTVMMAGQVQHPMMQYTALERANAAADRVMEASDPSHYGVLRISIADDFGRRLVFDAARVDMVLVQNIDQAIEGDGIVRLKQAQGDARLQKQAAADPAVKASGLVQMGPTGRVS